MQFPDFLITTTMIIPTASAAILTALRALMITNSLSAYIVPAEDEHYTEFVAECHQRRGYISKFTGSAGTAIVTTNSTGEGVALLWTDGRYYFQAEQEMDMNLWRLMRDGTSGTPTQAQWLTENLAANSRVGVDPALYTKGTWDNMESQLRAKNLSLVAIDTNLVDEIWETRPSCSENPIFSLDLIYAGKNTSDKVRDVRAAMADNGASVLLVAELDEVAWLLNLRGKDIPSSSTFFSFVILTATTLDFFTNNPTQVSANVTTALRSNVPEIALKSYEEAYAELPRIVAANSTGMVWVNRNANYKLVRTVDASRLLVKLTPISLMKSLKNDVEVAGYRRALIRDSAALCEFFSWLEDAMERGVSVNETSAATHLYQIRQNRSELFFDKSFSTISATGRNAAIIHYMPTEASSRPLSRDELYLLDSGGLYFDGTTDITRSMHFGNPTPFQREAYTRVLKGQIALATAKFPDKTLGNRLDSFAREALWEVGLEYNHGTGHGIGAFLNIHEGPQGIGSGNRVEDPGLQENMITSNEPGYYDEVLEFGIRLENVIRVAKVELAHDFQNSGWLGFEDMTFVPYSHKLINFALLTEDEIQYLNEYQAKTRDIVGAYLLDPQNNFPRAAYDWMLKETNPIGETTTAPPTSPTSESTSPRSGAANPYRFDVNLYLTLICLMVLLQ
ncbi:xaa-Pro aminopeptidase ApepP isoform X2 [Folsomia candida]|uniref:xaa-Pro aminopeptidase ApepP isoform X1 n=1 Tax=Folsomia candida TaxID=158441 RepID=UPI000B8F4C2E|nr:xaa-Pro aminopeptidase ApepP isoform X1 [Folsomia candida]XP_035705522.1 xaa-Pro aminopeptidase ApepP isoform X2 [Folsomia candida]